MGIVWHNKINTMDVEDIIHAGNIAMWFWICYIPLLSYVHYITRERDEDETKTTR